MKLTTAAVFLIAYSLSAAAQEVPSTARATSAVAPPPAPAKVERHTVEVTDRAGRPTISWTVEHRPGAGAYRDQVAESMAWKQSLAAHDASKTVTTRIPGVEDSTITVLPGQEAFGRLFDVADPAFGDPLMSYGQFFDPLGGALDVWRSSVGQTAPLFDDAELKRLFEPWSAEHGFGSGRSK